MHPRARMSVSTCARDVLYVPEWGSSVPQCPAWSTHVTRGVCTSGQACSTSWRLRLEVSVSNSSCLVFHVQSEVECCLIQVVYIVICVHYAVVHCVGNVLLFGVGAVEHACWKRGPWDLRRHQSLDFRSVWILRGLSYLVRRKRKARARRGGCSKSARNRGGLIRSKNRFETVGFTD